MAKVSSLNSRDSDARFVQNKCKWRMVPHIAMEATCDVFLAVTQPPLDSNEDGSKTHIRTGQDLLPEKKYSDVKENLRSLNYIINLDADEGPFLIAKSTVCIFRFEDVIFNLYPHMASMKRKGMTVKEIFIKNDPSKDVSISQFYLYLEYDWNHTYQFAIKSDSWKYWRSTRNHFS